MAQILDASDRSFLVVFDEAGRDAGTRVRRLHDWLRREPIDAVLDDHPAYATLLVTYDPLRCVPGALARELERRLGALSDWTPPSPRSFGIRVRYGGADGPDLQEVARLTGLSADAVVAAHAAAAYEVQFIGFSPGFPYLSGLPDSLRTPRRSTPQRSVPAGSVAIAGAQAGIYPVRSPGGWNVIGRTDFVLFDPNRDPFVTLSPGDRVRFEPVGAGT